MTTLLAIFLFAFAVALMAMMLVQAVRGTHDLFCMRNLFLAGLILFQFVSGGITLWTLEFEDFPLADPLASGTKFCALLTAFLVLFQWSYRRGWFVRARAWRSRSFMHDQKPATLLVFGALFLVLGFILRVVIGRNIPIVGVLADIMAVGVLAGAAGLATWAWAPRLWNPAVALPAAGIIMGAVATTVFLTFGRRDVVSVLITALFAAYHSKWKYQGWLRLGGRLGIIMTAGVLFLAAFSTVRFMTHKESGITDIFLRLTEADVSEGLLNMASGQLAGQNSMWIIENRPPYDPFHSAIYTVSQPIPRVIWPDKPIALGFNMVREASIYRVDPGYNVGAGLIGHIWNDNPYLTLIPYAVFFGLLWRYCDERVRAQPSNPFVILPIVAGSGDMIGLPRGELGLFLFRALTAMISAWIAMRVCAGILRTFGKAPPAPADDFSDAGEYGEQAPSEEAA